ncbi:MAG: hypothetical protein O2865_07105 [Planctomycetota bacterium]|nr:hypothetical protein [Planctomycetota bacterium]MDA0933908.1 hypothetical protein [Planctomycetota bacterium]MDA1222725.1 hypothetical protein [Planctomycetota bacterium]
MRIGWNLGNALVGLGLVGLGVTLSMPGWSADRVARVESRAEQACRVLATMVADSQRTLPIAPPAFTDEFQAQCRAAGQPESDLPELIAEDPLTFGSRHYLFRVVARELPTRAEGESAPLEVFAWPRTVLPPGRTTFCFPLDGDPVFTRNLAAGYEGLERGPRPGAALARGEEQPRRDGVPYRASNDERWLFLKAPPTD